MRPLPCNANLLNVAPRVMWFEPPERALAQPVRFLAYDERSWTYWNAVTGRCPAPPMPRRVIP